MPDLSRVAPSANGSARPVLKPKKANAMREAWAQLKRLGYDVIPLFDKESPYKGWPRIPNDEAAIRRWNGSTAGIRLYGSDLFVIDLDIRIAAVRDAIVADLEARWPAFMASCLRRHSGGVTLALIGRTATVKRFRPTRRFEGQGAGAKGDLVEVFSGASKRYLGCWGKHSEGRAYAYHGRSILETKVDALPWFAEADILVMLGHCEAIMAAHGLAPIKSTHEASGAHRIHDLEPAMEIRMADDSIMTLIELEDHARVRGKLADGSRLLAYATPWDPVERTPRVLVNVGADGLCLWDSKYEVSHRWKHRAPPPELSELATELRALVRGAWS